MRNRGVNDVRGPHGAHLGGAHPAQVVPGEAVPTEISPGGVDEEGAGEARAVGAVPGEHVPGETQTEREGCSPCPPAVGLGCGDVCPLQKKQH